MEIVKCCASVRLPGGERKWRRMARLAKFDGTVRVRGFSKRDQEPHEMVSLGKYFWWRNLITVQIKGHCGRGVTTSRYDPLATYGHELGHSMLHARGRVVTNGRAFRDNAEQRSDPIERACDRYSRLLRAKT